MATHSSVLGWRIPGTAKPGGLPSVGSHRVGHNWSDLAVSSKQWRDSTILKHLSILLQTPLPSRLPHKIEQNSSCYNDAKAETPVLWPPHAKSLLTRKDSDAGRDWGQEEKGTEDEMVGWHHALDGRESEWTPGVGDGQGGLACCDSWGRKESDTTERLNWIELNWNTTQK